MSAAAALDEIADDRKAPNVFAHPGPWTQQEFRELPETTWPRVELLDGALIVSPFGTGAHQIAIHRLTARLEGAVPKGVLGVVPGVNIEFEAGHTLIPDVVITTQLDMSTVWFQASEIVLAAEVVSPGSVHMDRLIKPAVYAEGGIPWYLRAELKGSNAPEILAFRLKDGAYVEHTRAHAGQTFHLDEPVEVSFDPAELQLLWP
jgi:Uma2 family endonuclease